MEGKCKTGTCAGLLKVSAVAASFTHSRRVGELQPHEKGELGMVVERDPARSTLLALQHAGISAKMR